jgi:membrane-bound inhibitor of C-type lysozyme
MNDGTVYGASKKLHFDKAFLSFAEVLGASGAPYKTENYPFLLTSSKHEWIIFRGYL